MREKWNRAFRQIAPTEEQKERIWREIDKKKGGKASRRSWNPWAAAAAACLIVFVMGVGVNAATGGGVVKSIQKMWGDREEKEQEKREVVDSALEVMEKTEAYAPDLVFCSDSYLAFAGLRGMILYDRKERATASVVDLQKINCNYFDTEQTHTRILPEGNGFWIFNEKSGKLSEKCYWCSLEDGIYYPKLQEKQPENPKKLAGAYRRYAKEHYVETFGKLPVEETVRQHGLYSRQSLCWTGKGGEKYTSCLLAELQNTGKQETYYTLLSKEKVTEKLDSGSADVVFREKLQIAVWHGDKAETDEKLPTFQYTGNNETLGALCGYMCKKRAGEWLDKEEEQKKLYLPIPIIYKTVREGNTVVVFGNMEEFIYVRDGNQFEEVGGGEAHAKVTLKEKKGSLQVVKFERARDGSYSLEDITRFSKGYPGLKERYLDWKKDEKKREKRIRQFLQMYVRDHGLEVKYYKAYGWDKKPIF